MTSLLSGGVHDLKTKKRMHEQRMYQCATAVEECEGGEEDNSMREGLGRFLDGERRISHHQITF